MAELLKIFDMDNMVREYIKKSINETNPGIDTSNDSAFDDIFIKPITPIISKLMQSLSNIEFKSNLRYVGLLSEADIDEIGEYNYFMKRLQGSKGTTTETFIFSNIDENTKIVIPAGVVICDKDETVNFVTVQRVVLTYDSLLSYYDTNTMDYRVPVVIKAIDVGTLYNKPANSLTKCLTSFSSLLVGVTNMSAVTNGTDKESNDSYVNRMRMYYSSQHLGMEDGYRRDILETCPGISSVRVVGKGHPLMTRDKIWVFNPDAIESQDENGNVTIKADFIQNGIIDKRALNEKGYGGKIDIYVKGTNYQAMTTNIFAASPVYKLNLKMDDIFTNGRQIDSEYTGTDFKLKVSETYAEINFVDPSSFDTTNTNCFTIVRKSQGSDEAVIVVKHSGYPTEFIFEYRLNDGSDKGMPSQIQITGCGKPNSEESFYSYDLSSPVSEIIDVTYVDDEGNVNTVPDDSYSIVRKSIDDGSVVSDDSLYYQSTKEQDSIRVTNLQDNIVGEYTDEDGNTRYYSILPITNNQELTIEYSANLDLAKLGDRYNSSNKILTADIMVKESPKTYVNVEFELLGNSGFNSQVRSDIVNIIQQYIDSLGMEAEIQMSDIVNLLYTSKETSSFVDYINLPFKSFYTSETLGSIDSEANGGNVLSAGDGRYFALGNCIVTEVLKESE